MTVRAPVDRPVAPSPTRAAVRRALRVTVAACLAFYTLRYGLGDPTTAVYGLFTVIALGALSDVQGDPPTRSRTYLVALLVGAVLVTGGTLAAVSTAVAAAGMLLVGFAVAYAGVGGPRVVGVTNGLQLLYVLPCFPPYAPDTLDQRLAGLVVGGALLVVADRLLLPASAPPPPYERLCVAADRIAAYAAAVTPVLRDPAAADATASGLDAARHAAHDAATALRLAEIPTAQRPVGPGARDRGLLVAHAATRMTTVRLAALTDLVRGAGNALHPHTADLVREAGAVFAAMTAGLRAGRPAPISLAGLDAALGRYVRARVHDLEAHRTGNLRAGLTAFGVADGAQLAVLGAGAFLGAPPPDPADTPRALWFVHAGRLELVWRRLRTHLTPRSVYFQNALRLAVGLAAARVVAGVADLSHGFWVLLATLSLMRTSAVAGRAVALQAFAGTTAGAVVAAGVLGLVGDDTWIYAWGLPLVMAVAFAVGPVLGIAAGQAAFTVVVALLFAQIAPVGWRLAEVRLTDVVVGGVIGAAIGAAVWPRGGGGEVRRAAAAGLWSAAAAVRSTFALLAEGRPPPATGPGAPDDLRRRAALLEDAYVQFRTEPAGRPGPDWLVVLAVVHRIDAYAAVLRARYLIGAAPPPAAAAALEAPAAVVATAVAAVGDALDANRSPPACAAATVRTMLAAVDDLASSGGEAALRLVDGANWLRDLADALDLLDRASVPPAAPGAG